VYIEAAINQSAEFFKGSAVERIAQYQIDEDFPSKTISLCACDSLTELPARIRPLNAHFVLFLAVNGREVDTETIYSVSQKLLDKGMVYACVWGPDCESVHDSIDQTRFRRKPEETDSNVIVTTWHAEESIGEAVCFFLNCAWPADDYVHTCSDWIAAVIGNPAWEAEVRAKLLAEKEESEST
jgi:hypothetical protein